MKHDEAVLALARGLARMLNLLSRTACLLMLATAISCDGEPKQVPYYGECHCECAAELQPCTTSGRVYCDVEGMTAYYEARLADRCKEFGIDKGYFNCALVDVGEPGEPSSKVTSLNPVDARICSNE